MHGYKIKIFYKIFVLIILDVFCATFAVVLSIFARYIVEKLAFPHEALPQIITVLKIWVPLNLIIFALFGMYNRLWEYAGMIEALRVAAATFCSFIAIMIVGNVVGLTSYRSCYLFVWIFLTFFTMVTRFIHRIIRALNAIKNHNKPDKEIKNIMIIGAGNAGNALLYDIERKNGISHFRVVCFIDDDSRKINKHIGNAKVVGGRDKIIWAANKYHIDEIIYAIPSSDDNTRREILYNCFETSCIVKTLPGYYQLISEKVSISMLRKVDIADLLERAPIELELKEIKDFIHGKTILVTGAGGSIGRELCCQLAKYDPYRIILFDAYENNVYFVQNELKEAYPNIDIVTLIGSVRDADRLDYIFSAYKPKVVYHAAAHKHVPLMENSPNEAVKNNVFGTMNMAYASDKYDVSRFVMISTDKAVNPTNVMGATKRICEMIIQYYDKHSKTEFVAVRFGNVLGSSGSVVKIFKKQIESGGPVTVTHPEIIRYFMTISEAVSLVLQAGTYAHGGEIFILDMGKPVKVLNLAEKMIRLYGLVPYKDIDIEFTGLRSGEKIFEELLMDEEGIKETHNKKIFIGKPIDMDEGKFSKQLQQLKNVMNDEDYDIRSLIKDIVPTYYKVKK